MHFLGTRCAHALRPPEHGIARVRTGELAGGADLPAGSGSAAAAAAAAGRAGAGDTAVPAAAPAAAAGAAAAAAHPRAAGRCGSCPAAARAAGTAAGATAGSCGAGADSATCCDRGRAYPGVLAYLPHGAVHARDVKSSEADSCHVRGSFCYANAGEWRRERETGCCLPVRA